MPFTPTIEQRGELLIASIGVADFNFGQADEAVEIADFLRRPVAKKYELQKTINEDFSFHVGFKGLYGLGDEIQESDDLIYAHQSVFVGGVHRVLAGVLDIDFVVGTDPSSTSQPFAGIQRILAELGHPLQEYYGGDNLADKVPPGNSTSFDFLYTLEQTSDPKVSVLRFNVLSILGCDDLNNLDLDYETLAHTLASPLHRL